tara:strand:- start:628 stop:1404 length:777 start_codon:yes stop_codon:yes gene_type:complete
MFEIKSLIDICFNAGKEILEIYKKTEISVEYKSDNSPLTLADKKSHDCIYASLQSLYPNIPILSEEGLDIPYEKRKKWTSFWLVDPIDGTKEFIKKNGEFTVNIALIENQKPVLGIVYAPAIDKYWYGSKKGSFAIDNGKTKKITVNNKFENEIKVVASRSHSSPLLKEFLKSFRNYKLVSMGSSIKICLVAEGRADIYPRLAPTMEWDTAAAHAVLKFAGGTLIDMTTQTEMTYNRKNLKNSYFIANSKMNLSSIIK